MKRMTKEDREFLKCVEAKGGIGVTEAEVKTYTMLLDRRTNEEKKEKLLTVILGLAIVGLLCGIGLKLM